MRTYRISRPTQALIAANLAVALLVTLQLLMPATASVAVDAPADGNAAELPDFGDTSRNPPAMSQFVDAVDRPLFYIARRLPEPPPEKAPPPPSPLVLQLEGVAIANGSRIAVLRNPNNRQLVQVEEGGTHEGWTLDAVGSGSASFSRGEQVTELLLDPASDGRR